MTLTFSMFSTGCIDSEKTQSNGVTNPENLASEIPNTSKNYVEFLANEIWYSSGVESKLKKKSINKTTLQSEEEFQKLINENQVKLGSDSSFKNSIPVSIRWRS